jgi:CheY-like chemotaxis protein
MVDNEPPRRHTPSSSKILVVEDSPSARKLLQSLMMRLGINLSDLRLASTVPEALQIYAQWRPDVVFLDLELRPPLDAPPAPSANPAAHYPKTGGELALQLLQRSPSLKIVICSASDPVGSEVADLVASGKVQSIVKPIQAAKVQTVLAAVGIPTSLTPRRP